MLFLLLVCSLFACDKSSEVDISEENVDSEVTQENTDTTGVEEAKKVFDQAYHDSIKQGIDNGDFSQNADKVVFLFLDEQMYSCNGLPSELRTESASEIRYIVNVTEKQTVTGTYSGIGESSLAIRIDYTLEMFDRIDKKTVISKTLMGSDPPFISDSGKNGYGDPPSDEELGQWISHVYQYRETGFIASYALGDFQYYLPADYTLEESESDTTNKYITDDKAIIIEYFSTSEYNFTSLTDFAQACKLSIEDNNKSIEEAGLATYTYGDIIEINDFLYFTYTFEGMMGKTEFRVIAFYETDNGFCVVEIVGNNTDAENEFVEIASTLRG